MAGGPPYYVSPKGKPAGTGASDDPFPSLLVALSARGPGQVYLLQPGQYPFIKLPAAFSGPPGQPTVISSQFKWQATIQGSGNTAGSFCCDTEPGASWITWNGLEICGGTDGGVVLRGDNCEVSDCYVHNNYLQGIDSAAQTGTRILRNLVEYNGSNPQYSQGVYLSGDQLVVQGNIIRHNSGYGVQLLSYATNCLLAQNVIYGHNFRAGLVLGNSPGGAPSKILNNTLAANAGGCIECWGPKGHKLRNNLLYCPTTGDECVKDENLLPVTTNDVDYNFCLPVSPSQGTHGRTLATSTPLWVNALTGAYWLVAASPAVQGGAQQAELMYDFWGRHLPLGAPDVGAFQYVPALATPGARANWYGGWSYRYQPLPGQDVPDFWAVPN
jgi:hypothetical protein